MFGEQLIVTGDDLPQRGSHLGIIGIGDVAERHERVATQMTDVAIGDVPATMTIEQLRIGGAEEIEQIDPPVDHHLCSSG